MRVIIIIGTLVAVLWSFAWFTGQHLIGTMLTDITQPGGVVIADGLTVDAEAHSISGFPFGMEIFTGQPRIASTKQAFSWSAQELSISSTLVGLNTVTSQIVAPQQLMFGTQEITYAGSPLNVAARVDLAASLPLKEILASSGQGQLSSNWGWNAVVDGVSVSLDGDLASADRFKLTLGLNDLQSNDVSSGWPAAESPLPLELQDFVFEANITLSSPLDRFAGTQGRPLEIENLELVYLGLKSGDLLIEIDSSLSWPQGGLPSGTVNLVVDQWRVMFDFVRRLGIINEQDEMFFQNTLANLAQASGDEDRIELPLVVDNGVVRFGFIVIGQLPSLL